jgi:hypothetical protein
MPLGRGILEVFEAIPDRIEVSGHGPTWKVTGGSFEAVLDYAGEAFGETAVLAREDRARWWPRVTLTVTTDPALMAEAPPLATFAEPEPEPDPEPEPEPEPVCAEPRHVAEPSRPETEADDGSFVTTLEEIFAHQEELRLARRRIPEQRAPR